MARQIKIDAREIGLLIKERQLNILVGSGVSCACGLPSWEDLINDMKKELVRNCSLADRSDLRQFLKSADPTKIAGLFKRRREDLFAPFLRARLRNRSFTLSPVLRDLARLPISTIFTTNFDKLLETACRSATGAMDPTVVTNPGQLPGLHHQERRIVKIHGDIDHPKTIVMTDEDYLHYDDRYESMRAYFQGQMAFSSLMLIGFGLRDHNFDRIYTGARRMLQGAAPRVIALMTKQNKFDRQRWEQNGLLINDFDNHDEIPAFLTKIRRFC